MGKSCWQQLTLKDFAVLIPHPNAQSGIIVASPMDTTKLPSAIIVKKKKGNVTESSVPSGVGVVKTILASDLVASQVILLFAESVHNTSLIGNMQFLDGQRPDADTNYLLFPYVRGNTNSEFFLLLTGRMGDEVVEYNVMTDDGGTTSFIFNPEYGKPTPATLLRVEFSGVSILKPWGFVLCLLPAIAIRASL
ncbi:unnamed protein product [Dibothriocephalus latus]|uniref:Uncharacterized protein n=1 Tax=Dibothriocephalus latus TaxID=60516 RepID=A0A3P7NTJ6_DIBLA|nr:unnamed protein product [Dibothriocephalus latus]